jgi:hypothetical protein
MHGSPIRIDLLYQISLLYQMKSYHNSDISSHPYSNFRSRRGRTEVTRAPHLGVAVDVTAPARTEENRGLL